MTTTKAQLDADSIRALLDAAVEHDIVARAKRRQAGRLLADLRSKEPALWRQLAGVDERLAGVLMDMACGRD